MLGKLRDLVRGVLGDIFSPLAPERPGLSQGIESAEDFWTRVDLVLEEHKDLLEGPEMDDGPRKINAAGQSLIRRHESLELEAYPDPGSALGKACAQKGLPMRRYREVAGWNKLKADPWTIGWGHTAPDVFPGKVISKDEADLLEHADLAYFEAGVTRLVKVPLTDNQFSALVSFAYNCGLDEDEDIIAEGLGDSTLLKKLNAGDYAGAAEQFLVWTKSGGEVLPGLKKRRAAERELFLA